MKTKPLEAIGIAAILLTTLAAHAGTRAADLPPSASGDATKLSPSTWPTFRGGHQFRGIAPGKLGDHFKRIWTFKTAQPIKSSAVISGETVYIGSGDGHVYALELATGQKRWSLPTGGPVEAPPLVDGPRIFIGSDDGILYALDAAGGSVRWKYQTGDRIVGSANLCRPAAPGESASIVVGSYDNFLHCVDAETGKRRWKFETENYVNGAAAVGDNQAVFGGCDGSVYAVSIADGRVQNKIELDSPIAGTIGLADGAGYIGHYGNQFVRIDLKNESITWTFEDRRFPFFSSPAIDETLVVFGSRARHVYCVQREDGELVWSFRTAGNVDSSPVICDGKVVVGSDDGHLYVLRLDTGEQLWSYQTGEAITGSPAVADGMIVVGAEDGIVYAFGAGTGEVGQ